MSNDEKAPIVQQTEGTSQCGPGCCCETTGLGTKTKMIVCLIVAIVAGLVLARALVRKNENATAQEQRAFTLTLPLPEKNTASPTAKASSWGEPLKSLASLSYLAGDDGAVFVYLPEKGQKPNQTTQKEIEAAASKARSGGTVVSFFTLGEDSPDYERISKQVPAPCVLAMVKGRGTNVVSSGITEPKLLQALVTASRPSGCGPGGCGPGGCK